MCMPSTRFAKSSTSRSWVVTSGVRVLGNTVTDADSGIQLHIASNNIVSGNRLYGNRVNQLWLQETHNAVNALGDLSGNTVTANQIAPTSATVFQAHW